MSTATEHETPKPLSELLEPGSTLMVGTEAGGSLEFRPLTVARVRGAVIDILVDANEDWARNFDGGDRMEITMSDNRTNVWASLHATGQLSRDDALIDELWNPMAAAYFDDGRQSSGIAALIVTASSGRYWSSPSGRIGSLVSMVKAKLGGAEDSGDHGPIQL